MTAMLPAIVCHCDWGAFPDKRWMTIATLDEHGYQVGEPSLVGDVSTLLGRLRNAVAADGVILVGFDFPIGLPKAYANAAGVRQFRQFLRLAGRGEWNAFYTICRTKEEISIHRPFYPNAPGGKSRTDLVNALGMESFNDLRRDCERKRDGRNAACPLFWTLGANQVGRGAQVGWREVIAPALADDSVKLWPFDGPLHDLLHPGATVIVETYPADMYRWIIPGGISGKGNPNVRAAAADALLAWARKNRVLLMPELEADISSGFEQGDDAFDSVVGLFGMLDVVHNQRPTGERSSESIRDIEGWILGLQDEVDNVGEPKEHRDVANRKSTPIELKPAHIREQTINFLLHEEFHACEEFQQWFAERVGSRQLQFATARLNVTGPLGESDIEVDFHSDGGLHRVLVENKIDARLQPGQAERYGKRAAQYVSKRACVSSSTMLMAPEAYVRGNSDAFEHRLSYEDILQWFAARSHVPRARWKSALLQAAIGRIPVRRIKPPEDPETAVAVAAFRLKYSLLADEVFPEHGMPNAEGKRGGFIYYYPPTLVEGVQLVHRIALGLVELQFSGVSGTTGEAYLRDVFGDLLDGFCIRSTEANVMVGVRVPALDRRKPFFAQIQAARQGIVAAKQLSEWLREHGQEWPDSPR